MEWQIVERTIELNVFNTMDFLLQNSSLIREKIAAGEVEIQGGIYDLETGHVKFLGKSPTPVSGTWFTKLGKAVGCYNPIPKAQPWKAGA